MGSTSWAPHLYTIAFFCFVVISKQYRIIQQITTFFSQIGNTIDNHTTVFVSVCNYKQRIYFDNNNYFHAMPSAKSSKFQHTQKKKMLVVFAHGSTSKTAIWLLRMTSKIRRRKTFQFGSESFTYKYLFEFKEYTFLIFMSSDSGQSSFQGLCFKQFSMELEIDCWP